MKKTTIVFALALPLLMAGPAAFAQEGHAGHAQMSGPMERAKMAGGKAAKKESGVKVRKVGTDEIGKDAVCPVTGEKFKISAETVSVSYKGKIYYFCCPGCDKSFMANPAKYAAGKPAAAKVYVCPMGEYQGDKPGKCPKCGMTLVEKKPAATAKVYVCPMGEYQGDKPGKCPKCGMALVEKK